MQWFWGVVFTLVCFVPGCRGQAVVGTPPGPSGPVPPEPVVRRVLVLFVTQRGAPRADADRFLVTNRVAAQAGAFYDEVSYGQLHFEPEFSGWYDVDVPVGACNLWRVLHAAVAAADPDVDFARGYSHLLVITAGWGCASSGSTPRPPEIRYATAEGEVTLASSAVEAGHATPLVVVHELGHQLHLDHDAGFLACGWQPLRDPVSQCFLQRYGDFYTAMGGGAYNGLPPHHFNAPEKEALGFLAAGGIQELSVSGRYRLAPLESIGGTPKALKLRGGNGAWIYVEYRQPLGCDAGMDRVVLPDGVVTTDVYEGALLHVRIGTVSYLIDAGAATGPGDWAGCALRTGETFVEPSTGDSITVVDRTPDALTVDAIIHVQREARTGAIPWSATFSPAPP